MLVPRPESELLVEAALDLPEGARVHDVGTGSGAIALALLDERPDLKVSASEVSPEAVEVARENAERLGLPLEVEVVDGVPPGDYDLVIANLPYVRDDRWEGLMPEINQYEPRVAITSGAEGLDAIRELIADMPSGTRVALEHASRPGRGDTRAAGRGRLLPRPTRAGTASPSAACRDARGSRDLRALHFGRRRRDSSRPTPSTGSPPSPTRARGWIGSTG